MRCIPSMQDSDVDSIGSRWIQVPRAALLCVVVAAVVTLGTASGVCRADGGVPPGVADPAEEAADGGAGGVWEFLKGFKPTLDLRVRYELGDQSGKDTSNATSARARLGLLTPEVAGFTGFAEMETTQSLDSTSYQAASVQGLGRNLTIIADPESTEVNQLWLRWQGETVGFKFGRQRMILDGARFVGNVGWRQNEQTYDAASFTSSIIPDLAITYAYIWRVNTIFGSKHAALPAQHDFDSHSQVVNLAYSGLPGVKLVGYGYFLDLSNPAGDNASNNTVGFSIDGSLSGPAGIEFGYYGEYARQKDGSSSTLDYRADYLHGRLSAKRSGITVGLGYEVLGADNGVGFQTPLATLHKYNGFADVFLNTPAAGLIDRYAWTALPIGFGVKTQLAYHDFTAEDSRGDFGREYDVVVSRPVLGKVVGLVKYAVFTSESAALRDIRRLVVQVEYKF